MVIFAAGILAAGCASKPSTEQTASPGADNAAPVPAEGGGDQGLDRLAKERKLSAVGNYQSALKLHSEGKDADALPYARQAVEQDPSDMQAQALLAEIREALGEASPANAAGGLDRITVQQEMLQRELNERLASGEKNLANENYAGAVGDFKEVLRIIRVGRLLIEAGDIEVRATDLLKQAEDKKREQDLVEQQKRDGDARRKIEAEIERKRQEREQRLKALWSEYEASRAQRDYDRARRTLEAIMAEDAENKASYLKDIQALDTERMEWKKKEVYRALTRGMEMMEVDLKESEIPYEKPFNYHDRDEWRKEVEVRAERIRMAVEVTRTMSDEDKKIWDIIYGAQGVKPAEYVDFNTASIVTRENKEGPPDLIDIVGQLRKYYNNIPFDIDVNLLNDDASKALINLDMPGAIKLSSLLNQICTQLAATATQPTAVAWRIERGAVMFKKKEDVADLFFRPYDVSDVIASIQDFPGAAVGIAQQEQGGVGAPVLLAQAAEENVSQVSVFKMENLEELIKKTTGGGEDSWTDDPTVENLAYIQKYNDHLLWIRQTAEGHAEIDTLLARVRGLGGLLVNIDVRFLTVEKDFLRQVGIDWRDLGPIDPLQLLGAGDVDTAHDIPNLVPAKTSGMFFHDSRTDIGSRVDNIVSASILGSNLTTAGGTSIQVQILDNISFEAIIHAVRKDSRNQILTAPRITCFNAQQASIFVGTQETYVSGFQGLGVGYQPILALADGPTVVCDVRPVVSADRRYITIFLRPAITFKPTFRVIHEQTGVDRAGNPIIQDIQLPTMDRQDLRTVAMVPDGGSVLIGGLKNADEVYQKSEVPLLGKVPLLGFFFRSEAEATRQRELLILVTARIIVIEEQEADM
jgi:hypothetical protein